MFLFLSELRYCACRQTHKSFFEKSDLFFVCMLRPQCSHIQKQHLEIEAARVIFRQIFLFPLTWTAFKWKDSKYDIVISGLLQFFFLSALLGLQWMPIEEYAAQPFVLKNEQFKNVAEICRTRVDKGYSGFAPMRTTTGSGKLTYLFCNKANILLWRWIEAPCLTRNVYFVDIQSVNSFNIFFFLILQVVE